MVTLYPHQVNALYQTDCKNRCAIKGYEGLYEIDRQGNVYSCVTTTSRRKGLIKTYIDSGYVKVGLTDTNHVRKNRYIHRLVAQTFIPNPNNLPEVNHIDGNKLNNHVENLEWCTSKENQKHAYREHLQIPKYKLSAVQVDEIRKLYVPKSKEFGTVALAKKFNVCQSTIYKIVKGMTYKEGDKFEVI